MTFGVMSDTHGNAALLLGAAAMMTATHGASAVFHLGDDYEDGQALIRAGYTVHQVPGLWCAVYRAGSAPRCLVESFDGVTIACAHADKDLRHQQRAAAIVLTGHTHCAHIHRFGHTLYINPGHLAALHNRGQKASYAILDITPETVRAAIYDISGKLRHELVVERTALV